MPPPETKKHRATVAIGFVHGMLSGLKRLQRDPQPILERAGIAAGQLDEAGARLPIDRYAALYNLINRELDDEGFGLFSQPLRCGSFEFLCRSVVGAPDLAQALDRATRFLRLVLPDLGVVLKRGPSAATLEIVEHRPLAEGRVFAYEWLLRILHGLSSWLVGRPIALDEVEFPYPRPAHADDYTLIYTAHFGFDAPYLCARFNPGYLDLPIRRDEAALRLFLDGAPGKLTTLYRRDRELSLRVRNCLRASLPESASLEQVASRLYLSPRTLHRHLEEEGANFRAIKDALRRDLALEQLAKTSLPLNLIAARLGFADCSSFYRAFVGWTGMAPQHYRQQLQRSQA